MAENINDFIVNDDEFQMLSEMTLDIEEPDCDPRKVKFDIKGTNGKDALLFQLGLADDTQLVANYGNHHLVFPVQIEMGDFNNFSINLNSPKIFETGNQLRSWRLLADKTISLVNDAGEDLNYQIKDLSASGISLLVDVETDDQFPMQLNNIYLQLPNRDRLAISGSQIRRVDDKTVAYSLGASTDDTVLTELAEYLFECHAEQHPEAHSNQFK